MLLTKKGAYDPVIGLMPSPLEEVPEERKWFYERWATPYMAAVARVIFRRKPEVSLTPQLAPERIIERVGGYVPLPLAEYAPDVTLTPQLTPERIIEGLYPMPNSGTAKYYAGLGFAPKLGEWFKKNRILVVVVIVALVVLFFFLKKGRR